VISSQKLTQNYPLNEETVRENVERETDLLEREEPTMF